MRPYPNPNPNQAAPPSLPPVHVPYRNSKLTHLLHDCLGGNCRAAMLFGLSPALFRLDEVERVSNPNPNP